MGIEPFWGKSTDAIGDGIMDVEPLYQGEQPKPAHVDEGFGPLKFQAQVLVIG